MDKTTCAVDGCDRTDVRAASGWCTPHHDRAKRSGGNPGKPEIAPPHRRAPVCCVDGCDRPGVRRGMCHLHRRREVDHGDPLYVMPFPERTPKGADHPFWLGQRATYGAHHQRVNRFHGKASGYRCKCGETAKDWALDKNSPHLTQATDNGYLVSVDPNDYIPMCRACHGAYDAAWRKEREAAWLKATAAERQQRTLASLEDIGS